MEMTAFENKIKPFFWSEYEGNYSVCLGVGEFRDEIFETRADEGFEGSGYDWASLADVFLNEKMAELKEVINFDPEGSMFCAYSADKTALQKFTLAFKEACEDDECIQDLFSRAELD